MPPQQSAVVFAYHNVGVRGLSALLSCGINVRLVVTHEDSAAETIWFESVEALAQKNDIPVIKPSDPNAKEVVEQVTYLAPDWLFSFYYRHMLDAPLLATPANGAFNLHGSLLPKYRGRVPVNWAIIHGETLTGASLHRMTLKPDAGHLLDQQAVPILPNDTAAEVFQKITCAAEIVLMRTLPKMMNGSAEEIPLQLERGSYFGGRKPADGLIDWSLSAQQIHNLIRALAPPYPGAFAEIDDKRLMLFGSYFREDLAVVPSTRLYWENRRLWADCSDGKRLLITQAEWEGQPLTEEHFQQVFGAEYCFRYSYKCL